jgi:hypothetical protein
MMLIWNFSEFAGCPSGDPIVKLHEMLVTLPVLSAAVSLAECVEPVASFDSGV